MSDHKLLTIREASNCLGLQESTLRKWILQKRISYCKLGRAVRIPPHVVEEIISEGYREAIATGGGRDH